RAGTPQLEFAEGFVVARACGITAAIAADSCRAEVVLVEELGSGERRAGLLGHALVAEEDVVRPGAALLFGDNHGAAVAVVRGCPADGLLRASALCVHRIGGGSARRSHEVLGVEGEAGVRAVGGDIPGVVEGEIR